MYGGFEFIHRNFKRYMLDFVTMTSLISFEFVEAEYLSVASQNTLQQTYRDGKSPCSLIELIRDLQGNKLDL